MAHKRSLLQQIILRNSARSARYDRSINVPMQELNQVKEIPLLLQAASSAISVLTQNPSPGIIPSNSYKSRSDAFKVHDEAFHTHLKKIQDDLLDQVDELQEEGLIVEKLPKAKPEEGEPTNGGLGGLDVGYLNSRARDVGIGKEGELVAEALKLAEKIVKGKKNEIDGDDVMEE